MPWMTLSLLQERRLLRPVNRSGQRGSMLTDREMGLLGRTRELLIEYEGSASTAVSNQGRMNSKRALCLLLIFVVTLGAGLSSVAQTKELPKIVILATGGTIAGASGTGTQAGYTSGAVTIDS